MRVIEIGSSGRLRAIIMNEVGVCLVDHWLECQVFVVLALQPEQLLLRHIFLLFGFFLPKLIKKLRTFQRIR